MYPLGMYLRELCSQSPSVTPGAFGALAKGVHMFTLKPFYPLNGENTSASGARWFFISFEKKQGAIYCWENKDLGNNKTDLLLYSAG